MATSGTGTSLSFGDLLSLLALAALAVGLARLARQQQPESGAGRPAPRAQARSAVAWLADGPSGLVYYPGTGWDDKWQGHFFLVDFRGSPGASGVRSFAVKPKGASFELVDSHTNFAQIQDDKGNFVEQLITKDHQTIPVTGNLAASPLQNAGFFQFVRMGIMHIFTGIDHMSFMLGLVLLSRRLRDLLFVVTGFTVGHSRGRRLCACEQRCF